MTNYRRNSKDQMNVEKPVRKRIRDNHNELERVRRNNQKAQLEALRMALPFQDMDEKASMVSIFIRAREYIGMLEQRVMELQSNGAVPEGEVLGYSNMPPPSSSSSKIPSLQGVTEMSHPTSPLGFARNRQYSVNADQIQIHHGISFYNPGFLPSSNTTSSIEMASLVSPMSSPTPQKHSENSLNADILRSFVADNFIKNGASHRLSAEEENNFLKNFYERRHSSLLMPFEAETVMVQKRDSISTLFSGLIPDFVDSSVINSGDIKCHKCQRGMCNMIMIDCDRCHKWYHIKCAHIDSDSIPTNWNCC